MSKTSKGDMGKVLRYFIIFDLILALLFIINFNFKSKNDGTNISAAALSFLDKMSLYIKGEKPVAPEETSTSKQEEIIDPTEPVTPPENKSKVVNQKIKKQSTNTNVNNIVANGNYFQSSINGGVFPQQAKDGKGHSPICITYGPLDLEQKSSLDVIVQHKIDSKYLQVSKAPLYEVYWNLGTNKIQAIDRFEHQKNDGALQDEKFKLTQTSEGEWIVPISTVAGNLDIARKMIRDLSKSAANIGGKWQYRTKTEGYFYQFKDMSVLPNAMIDSINHTIDTLKTPC